MKIIEKKINKIFIFKLKIKVLKNEKNIINIIYL